MENQVLLRYAIQDYLQKKKTREMKKNILSTNERLMRLLASSQVSFKELVHKPTLTSIESAQVRNATLESGAKAMICHIPKENRFIMCVLSASKSVSYSALKKCIRVIDITLAPTEKVNEITGCLIGAVPPFGSLFGLQTYLDPSLQVQGEFMNFNAGLRTHSINMEVKDYLNIEKPIIIEFAK